ncbi:hypothetical protein J7T55_004487 [Diaporthe amygdali]|uniref:uncharacterized protein n=1 Tax=Phomopsis amygdali TaxID=1214568 RepID=UPI0022FE39C0|nr:uncharacterized protein J7T55_004487 [Diaporthe amygdali]KAJ0114746.1 hypothetical protein J7T55_004487 [Diaporthe amygdali]
MQGSGKSTWANSLAGRSRSAYQLKTPILSLDDLYHTYENLIKIRERNSSNELFATLVSLEHTMRSLPNSSSRPCWLAKPSMCLRSTRAYLMENETASRNDQLEEHWAASKQVDTAIVDKDTSTMLMRTHALEYLQLVNDNLRRYNESFKGPEEFDYFVHLDTKHLHNVYRWRIPQEEALRVVKGTGQRDEQIIAFVQAYMPASFTHGRNDLFMVRTDISETIAPEVSNGSSAFTTRYPQHHHTDDRRRECNRGVAAPTNLGTRAQAVGRKTTRIKAPSSSLFLRRLLS